MATFNDSAVVKEYLSMFPTMADASRAIGYCENYFSSQRSANSTVTTRAYMLMKGKIEDRRKKLGLVVASDAKYTPTPVEAAARERIVMVRVADPTALLAFCEAMKLPVSDMGEV